MLSEGPTVKGSGGVVAFEFVLSEGPTVKGSGGLVAL